jgi:putative N6-adenine-specific DNA methylase
VTDSRWAALKLKDGICDAQRELYGERSVIDKDSPSLPLRLRIHRERATLLLDSSGEPLDRRGYRRVTGDAPARENLAAACILAVDRWDGRGPIADPMCGTGTLLIEAAFISKGRAPGWLRKRWAFQAFPSFDGDAWRAIRREFPPSPDPDVQIFGNDIKSEAVRAANVNFEAARLEEQAFIRRGPLRQWQPPGPTGLLMMNPPYGRRIEGEPRLWHDIGELLNGRCGAWAAVILGGPERRWRRMRIEPYRVLEVRNGPLEAEIVVFAPRRRSRGR